MQKSHMDWLRYEDQNTKFFHTSTLARRRRNKIEMLQDESGTWVEDCEALMDMAV